MSVTIGMKILLGFGLALLILANLRSRVQLERLITFAIVTSIPVATAIVTNINEARERFIALAPLITSMCTESDSNARRPLVS